MLYEYQWKEQDTKKKVEHTAYEYQRKEQNTKNKVERTT